MVKIVISEFMDIHAVGDQWRSFEVVYEPDLVDRPDTLTAALKDASALVVRNRTQVTASLLDEAPGLTCIGRLGVGLDNINQQACAKRHIEVYPAIGANNPSVAEYVLTASMILLRTAYRSHDEMIAGAWPRQQCSGRELAGATLGLVGLGGIAQLTARLAAGLGVKPIACDPYLPPHHAAWDKVEQCDLMTLLERSDIVSLHTPLTAGTRHLIDARAIATMKDDAVLINAARGGIVDEDALILALKEGWIGGAALDVFEDEPLTEEAATRFRGLTNVLLTPHIAGVTTQSNARVSTMIAEKIATHLTAVRQIARDT